jgi:ferredoxin
MYRILVRNRGTGQVHAFRAPADRYLLDVAEEEGLELPFSCHSGVCTTCAVRVLSGRVRQPEALGLGAALKASGYALLCVAYADSDLSVETQDEDEVYLLQFGGSFDRGKVLPGLPLAGD